ncbi:putative secreted protein [Wickerhamomyces ciferrii]|uniref:Secreted protein n=1 Tax=Wickerhamomyces ciferrii (strain ATCC 14091 / BCRC 22168 / CBS 111 / JCM 3599 / NBRC 0793 / NRRL Y-1031 F-60-10) TaxID=1206466 RepID=K0KH90_WICCF|nr:uncharacterized protein BN7_4152 [Wickerhamomyces ciferrii]CCH44585.1 putative secreted protein [Wickerhamomyces ciferrii]
MQFSTLLATAVALTGATAAAIQNSTVKFTIESPNQDVNNKGLSSIHEGAAINYFFAGEASEAFGFDTKTGVISKTVEIGGNQSYEEFFGIQQGGNFQSLQTSPTQDNTKWAVDNGYLTGNGSDSFFAVKGTNDPYNYSEESYQIGIVAPHAPNVYKEVVPIKIKANLQ